MKVAFITNGSSDIGYGHISRILVLKEYFEANNVKSKILIPESFTFETNEDYVKVKSFRKTDLEKELLFFDILIIDSIEKDYDMLSWTSDINKFIVSITLFLFDFNKRYEHVSFFPSIEDRYCKIINLRTKLFGGRNYVVFREEFEDIKFDVNRLAKSIVITMGGTDPYGLTTKVLKALAKFENWSVTILLSKKSNVYTAVAKEIKSRSNFKLIEFEKNLAKLFSENDIAIINGGITRYETCVVGIPFIALSIHKTQFEITEEFVNKGVGVNLGVFDEINEGEIETEIVRLMKDYDRRLSISQKMKKLFDTNGSKRIFEIITQEYFDYEKNDQKG